MRKPLRSGRVFLKAVALTNNSSVGMELAGPTRRTRRHHAQCTQGRHKVSGTWAHWGTLPGSQTQVSSGSLT